MTQFILASASPRRRELLADAGYNFDIIPADLDENSFKTQSACPAYYTKLLSEVKADAIAVKYPSRAVLGSDCIVELGGRIYEKPDDAEDARRIISELFREPHNVITSVALICKETDFHKVITVTTKIYPVRLTDEQIEFHIQTGRWQGRAGGYGIQDPHTDQYIERIEGSFTNVVGLPMEETASLLAEFGIYPAI